MDLILDIGNTHIKAAWFKLDALLQHRVFGDEPALLNYLSDVDMPQRLLMSSSSGKFPDLPSHWKNVQKITFDWQTPIPIESKYLTPETLGRDRLAAAIGAVHLYPLTDILTIDCGTCITFDFVNRKGQYLGGSISPGLNMRYKAMHQFTGKLPLIAPSEESPHTGNTTESSMISGVQMGIVYEIDGQIDHYRKNYPDLKVIITGGDARYFVNRLKNEIFADQNLVLIGLHQILKYNDQ